MHHLPKDRKHPVKVTEYMAECKRPTQPWQSHPKRMLRHKATIQCARLAFGFVGIYEQDEAERIIEAEFSPAPPRAQRHAATVAAPVDSPERQALIAELQGVADSGTQALSAKWQAIGAEARTMVGAAALDALKARAADADPVEASE